MIMSFYHKTSLAGNLKQVKNKDSKKPIVFAAEYTAADQHNYVINGKADIEVL